ncbi:hypothetical protein GEV49_03420 [Streptomyces sp. SYP-A7193]|nr:hypothetical protein GEV49_03420 [Streptomyces sp. SYP-A7193]
MRLNPAKPQLKARTRKGGPVSRRAIAPPRRYAVTPHPPRSSQPTTAEADAWADVLVRWCLLHAVVLTPTGQRLVQDRPDGPVRILASPADVLALAATIQQRTCSTRPESR